MLQASCQKPAMTFPLTSLDAPAKQAGAFKAYDARNTGHADFFVYTDDTGRINRIGYDTTCCGKPNQIVPLDPIPFSQCRHLVIFLDGFSYDVVKSYRDQGHLRFFYPPAKVIAPYPTLTDICIQQALGNGPANAPEDEYYSNKLNKVEGGSLSYLKGTNEPYDALFQYRTA